MAQQPQLEQNVFPDVNPTPQANGADFGAQVGEAQQGFGQQVQRTGDVIAENVLKWQGLKNDATAQDMDVRYQMELGNLETAYYGLSGKAAADAQPKFEQDVLALRQRYLGMAPNPMVANALGQSLSFSTNRALLGAGRYAGDQTRQWVVQSGDARAQMLALQVGRNYADQNYYDTALAGIKGIADNIGDAQNWSQDQKDLYVAKYQKVMDDSRVAAAKGVFDAQTISDQLAALSGGTGGDAGKIGGADYRAMLVQTEFGSGVDTPGNPHKGPVQADDAWLQRFAPGKTRDQMTMQDWMSALDRETAVNAPALKSALGRPVTNGDLYLAHQQGLGGAIALLNNPDKPAADVVGLANVEGNVPQGTDPTKITAGDFAKMWTDPFTAMTSQSLTQTGAGVKAASAALSVLDPATHMELTKRTLDTVRTAQNAAYEDQQRAIKAANDAQKQQTEQAVGAVQLAIYKNHVDPVNNPQINLAQVFQTPLFKNNPDAQSKVLAWNNRVQNPVSDNARTQQNTVDLYSRWLKGQASAQDFQQAFVSGDISQANLKFLQEQSGKKDGGEDAQTKTLKAKFLTDHKISALDETDSDANYRFAFDFSKAWDAKVAAGKDPRVLITPGDKEYFGSLNNLALYSQTAKDKLDAAAAALQPNIFERALTAIGNYVGGPTAEATAPVAIPPDLPKGTTYGGKDADGRDLFKLPSGRTIRAKTASAPPPAPDTGPAVPTVQ